MNDCKSCYSCIYYLKEWQENEVWCPLTGRIIDDGWGRGDSNTCNQFVPE